MPLPILRIWILKTGSKIAKLLEFSSITKNSNSEALEIFWVVAVTHGKHPNISRSVIDFLVLWSLEHVASFVLLLLLLFWGSSDFFGRLLYKTWRNSKRKYNPDMTLGPKPEHDEINYTVSNKLYSCRLYITTMVVGCLIFNF